MKVYVDNCNCLDRLINIGMIKQYSHSYNHSGFATEPEVGELCLVSNIIETCWEFDQYVNDWVNSFEIKEELFPINNCPLCGKKIMYRDFDEIFSYKLTLD